MIVDIIVGAILVISAVISFIRGFIREVLTIAGVGGGMVTSYFFGDNATKIVEGLITPEPSDFELAEASSKLFGVVPYDLASGVIAYGSVFIAVVGILSVISHFMAEGLKKMGLGAVDRSMGVVFGLVRGILVLGLIYLPVYMLMDTGTKDKWLGDARSYVYLEKTAEMISSLLPQPKEPKKEEGKEEEEEEGKKKPVPTDQLFGTREMLQDLDVLKKDIEDSGVVDDFKKGLKGYTDDFRDEMDQIFEEEQKQLLKRR